MSLGDIGDARIILRAESGMLTADMNRAEAMMGSALSKIGALAATYLSFDMLRRGLVAAWTEAGRAAEAITLLESRLRSTGGAAGMSSAGLVRLADDLQRTTIYENDAIIGMQSLLLTYTQIKGDVFVRATRAILDMSRSNEELAGNAQLLGKALENPAEGMMFLRRAGIILNDTQKEQIRHFQEMGELEKAQGVLLDILATKFGGTAEALRATPWGEAKALANTFGDTLENIGNGIGRAVHPALILLNKDLAEWNAQTAGANKTGDLARLFDLSTAKDQLSKVTTALAAMRLQGFGEKDLQSWVILQGVLAGRVNQLTVINRQGDVWLRQLKDVNAQIEKLGKGKDITEWLKVGTLTKQKADIERELADIGIELPIKGILPLTVSSNAKQSGEMISPHKMSLQERVAGKSESGDWQSYQDFGVNIEQVTEQVQTEWDAMNSNLQQGTADAIHGMVADWTSGTNSFIAAFDRMGQRIAQMIMEMVVEWAFFSALIGLGGLIGGGFGGFLSGIGHAGKIGAGFESPPSGQSGQSVNLTNTISVSVGNEQVVAVVRRLDMFDQGRGLVFA